MDPRASFFLVCCLLIWVMPGMDDFFHLSRSFPSPGTLEDSLLPPVLPLLFQECLLTALEWCWNRALSPAPSSPSVPPCLCWVLSPFWAQLPYFILTRMDRVHYLPCLFQTQQAYLVWKSESMKSSNWGFTHGSVCGTLKSDRIKPGSCDHWQDLTKPRLSLFRSKGGITVNHKSIG